MGSASDMIGKKDTPSASDTLGAGSALLTKKLRIEYGKANVEAQTGGDVAPSWAEWLGQQGYALDRQGLAYKASQ